MTQNIVASESLETELKMELMTEKQIMGMSFHETSSIDCCFVNKSQVSGFSRWFFITVKFANVGSSDDDLGEKLKMISHPVDQVDDLDQINQDPQKNNMFEKVLGQVR